MEKVNPELRFRKLWIIVGYLMIALVVYLSLTGRPVKIDTNLPYQDKFFHALAYFLLTFWFMQIYHIRHQVFIWMLFFLCLGLLMEYLQGFEPNRYSEVSDMVANTLGVLAALVLSRTRVRFMLVRLEQYITQ